MKNNMKNVFIDTSILSRIIWSRSGKYDLSLKNTWNTIIEQIDQYIPNVLDNFKLLDSNLLFLEIIGLGSIKDKKNKDIIFSHRPFNLDIKQNEWKNFYPDGIELFIEHVGNRIENFICKQLTQRNLYRQTIAFKKNYSCHENSHFVFATVKNWGKTIKNPESYAKFKRDFYWDTLSKYPFINLDDIPSDEQEQATIFWGSIMGFLFRQYLEIYKQDFTFEANCLGLFAEINRIGSLYKHKGYHKILKQWSDMVDAESIHYALIGKRKTLNVNEPVIVITGDKTEDIKRRLECSYKNLIEISEIPSKHNSDLNLKINMCPGIVICIDVNKNPLQVVDYINVQDYIEKIKMNTASEPVKQ